jgi:hypothetical protein
LIGAIVPAAASDAGDCGDQGGVQGREARNHMQLTWNSARTIGIFLHVSIVFKNLERYG